MRRSTGVRASSSEDALASVEFASEPGSLVTGRRTDYSELALLAVDAASTAPTASSLSLDTGVVRLD